MEMVHPRRVSQAVGRMRTRPDRPEYEVEGKGNRFELWERFLPGRESPLSYAEAAAQAGVPEGTFKFDVHRLRRR